jgi:hypothetical protein
VRYSQLVAVPTFGQLRHPHFANARQDMQAGMFPVKFQRAALSRVGLNALKAQFERRS